MARPTLSPRQRQVLTCAANGFVAVETAAVLDVAPATVRVHMEAARRRLDAKTIAHAVALAIGAGLIDPMNIPSISTGSVTSHRNPHMMTEAGGLAYDPQCMACQVHGSWREGVADVRSDRDVDQANDRRDVDDGNDRRADRSDEDVDQEDELR